MYGDDWRYARTRLQNSVVSWKDKLVRVDDVIENVAYIQDVTTAGAALATCPLAELDVKPLKLGYVNHNNIASYICRAPVRRDWRQGIRHATMRSLSGRHAEAVPFKCINNTHLGKFPKLDTCTKIVGGRAGSRAWSRDWALNNLGELLYRGGRVVGTIKDGVPTLNPHYIYLKESLEASYEKG